MLIPLFLAVGAQPSVLSLPSNRSVNDVALSALFNDVPGETSPPQPVTVKGTVPAWLQLTKTNNGFGAFGGPGYTLEYLFDVMSYVQRWEIKGSKVTFANRIVRSHYYNVSRTRAPRYRTFGGYNTSFNIADRAIALAHLLSDNYNVNIFTIAGKLLTNSDMSGYFELDPTTLESIGTFDWNNDPIQKQFLSMITSAHPSQLPGDKYLYNYHVGVFSGKPWNGMQKFELWRVDTTNPKLERETLLTWDLDRLSYMHSYAHTPNYLVMMEFNLFWDVVGLGMSTTILPELEWNPKNGTRIKVYDIQRNEVVAVHYTDAVFAYHHVNAWEVDGAVQLQIMSVPCTDTDGPAKCRHMNAFNLNTLRNDSYAIPSGTLIQYTVPTTQSGSVRVTVLNELGMDLSTVHPDLHGKKNRFVWSCANHGTGVWWNNLVKVDLQTNETIEWYREGHYPSEPNFIPRPGATNEDDGVLLSIVLGGDINTSYLLFLDAHTMAPIAEAAAPYFLPFPSHGETCTEERGCVHG